LYLCLSLSRDGAIVLEHLFTVLPTFEELSTAVWTVPGLQRVPCMVALSATLLGELRPHVGRRFRCPTDAMPAPGNGQRILVLERAVRKLLFHIVVAAVAVARYTKRHLHWRLRQHLSDFPGAGLRLILCHVIVESLQECTRIKVVQRFRRVVVIFRRTRVEYIHIVADGQSAAKNDSHGCSSTTRNVSL